MKTFRQFIREGFDVKDGGNGKVYHTAETQSDAEIWAKDNVNKLHRPLKVISGYKIYKQFEPKTIIKESVLPTENEACTKEAWNIAFVEVQKATGWNDKFVRDWLDSRDGRHFADQCIDFGAGKNPKDGISQAAKFYKERKWF